MVLSLAKLEQLRYVKIEDNTLHLIEHIDDFPLSHIDQRGLMRNVLHVLMITKNLVLVKQIIN